MLECLLSHESIILMGVFPFLLVSGDPKFKLQLYHFKRPGVTCNLFKSHYNKL